MFPKIIIDSPWYFFLLSLLAGLGLTVVLYYKNKKNAEVPRIAVRMIALLRFVFVSVIAFLLLNILFRRVQNETQDPVILVALDNSSSIMAGGDSASVRKEFLPALEAFQQSLGAKYTVRRLLFGDRVRSDGSTPDFKDKETDLENLLRDVENNYSGQNVGALVLISDGIYNRGMNPVNNAEKTGFPVYTIALGDTNEVKDIAIQKINHNQVAYAGNNFPVEVLVSARQFSGRDVTVSLLRDGVEKAKKTIKITGDDLLSTNAFSLTAEASGFVKYTVRVTALDGEKNVSNNNQTFVIEVIDNREKILVLSNAPHPDLSALNSAILNNSSFEPEFALTGGFKKPLKPYSLVILHGYEKTDAPVISECVNNRIPLWIIDPSDPEALPGLRVRGTMNRFNDAEPVFNPSFGLFNLSDGLKALIRELPAVNTPFGVYEVSNGANSLISQRIGSVETDDPLFYFNEVNGHKTGVFIGNGLWRWSMRDYQEHSNHDLFNELVSKTIQYLAVKSDKSFFRINAPKLVNENETVELSAEVYNKSYELITDPDVILTLTNAEGKKFNYTFGKSQALYRLNLGMLAPGEYKYEAKVKVKDELFVKQGMIVVREMVAEKINTVANHQILYQLAGRSNGKLYYPEQLGLLEKELMTSEQIKPVTFSQAATSPLIEMKFLFWLILMLMAVEWFFRKRFYSI